MTKRRKNYFIKREFQANFFVRFILLLLLEAVLITVLFMLITRGTLTTAYHGTELTIQKTSAYFFLDFILITLIVGAGIGIAGTFVFVYLTHRLGGPLYRFEKAIEEARQGNIAQRINLRRTDQLSDLRDRINAFLEETDSRISRIKADIEQAVKIVSEGAGSGDTDKLRELLARIKSSLEYFKTSK